MIEKNNIINPYGSLAKFTERYLDDFSQQTIFPTLLSYYYHLKRLYDDAYEVINEGLNEHLKNYTNTKEYKKETDKFFLWSDENIRINHFLEFRIAEEKAIILFSEKKKSNQSNTDIIELFNENERGSNVPYKIAMLDELGIIKNLKMRYPIETDVIKIIHYLVSGNYDNVKNYYYNIYGNYSGNLKITSKHRQHAKLTYYK